MDNIYTTELINDKIKIHLKNINENIVKTIEELLENKYGGLCIRNGYVKKGSIKLISYSLPLINNEYYIFNVVYSAEICNPVKNMIVKCKVDTIVLKAGIEGYLYNESKETSPIIVYLSKDYYYDNTKFLELKEDDIFTGKIITTEYTLYDPYITVFVSIL
jgi:DNA-directed RNA polymerase subunit E'/Rpb7